MCAFDVTIVVTKQCAIDGTYVSTYMCANSRADI
jgi:hypothetical protein